MRGICGGPLRRTRGGMESLVMALRGLFLRRKPARMNREQTSGAPGGSPPLGPYLARGSQSGPRLRAPPPGARLRWPGTPAPGQHQPHLIFGGQAWPPLARPPRCFLGGRCGGLLAVVGQAPASYIVGGGARGGPPAGVGSDAIGSTRCAHWSSQHVSAPAAGGLPLPGIQCPPCPPGGGGRRLDNGKEGSVRETQEGCPSPFKSIVFGTFSKFQKRKRRGKKYFCRAGV